jgi:hypothetical protein
MNLTDIDHHYQDPALVIEHIEAVDPYLIPYLRGWWGLGPAQPWGAAMSFALEMAREYRLIRGESDTTPTKLGELVKAQLKKAKR